MYLFHTPSLPKPNLPSRERLQQLGDQAITVLIWTAAITVTALRITRTSWGWLRPRLARLLHALALLLDPQLATYPDQPEPDPDPGVTATPEQDSVPDFETVYFTGHGLEAIPTPAVPAPAATKPRPARRSRAKAASKEAA